VCYGVERGEERPWHEGWRREVAMALEQAVGNAAAGGTGADTASS
jgi:hypothetical protein